jgi:hypothetical protein
MSHEELVVTPDASTAVCDLAVGEVLLSRKLLRAITPPTRSYSEKFSRNFALFLRKRLRASRGGLIRFGFYFVPDEDGGAWDPEKATPSDLYVGRISDIGWLSGLRLSEIITASQMEDSFAFPIARFSHGLVNVTADLFPRYMKQGKCAWDPLHSVYWASDRFEVDGDRRVCRWCGRVEDRHIEEKLLHEEVWSPYGVGA